MDSQPGPAARLTVTVKSPATRHELTMAMLVWWLGVAEFSKAGASCGDRRAAIGRVWINAEVPVERRANRDRASVMGRYYRVGSEIRVLRD